LAKVDTILFIVEGVKTEPFIMENLKKYFLKANETIASKNIIVSYGTVIYGLYKKFLNKDGELDLDIDTFPILRKIDMQLKDIKRKDIDQIYLFFDYDGHASNARDDKLFKMLELFNDELDKGKLFVSYPMVEALRHLKDDIDFKDTKAISEKAYKNISKECDECFLHFNDYLEENWHTVISQHCQKANFIVNDTFEFPKNIIEQLKILEKQKEKYIDTEEKVGVLSAFPLFLLDYYGVNSISKRIEA